MILPAFITTIWFFIGGVLDIRNLFKDLQKRIDNPLDNGQVEGEISLSDIEEFQKREQAELKNNTEEKK